MYSQCCCGGAGEMQLGTNMEAQASAQLLMVYKVIAVKFPLVGLWTRVGRP